MPLWFDKWAVLGHSFGAQAALEYALRSPDRLSHLLLLDTGGGAGRSGVYGQPGTAASSAT